MRSKMKVIACVWLSLLGSGQALRGRNLRKHPESRAVVANFPAPILWQNPVDLKTRDLYYGAGGQIHAPGSSFTFEKEDMAGTGPKFVVRDDNGVKWKVKMGNEPRSETAASRIVWAAGYSTNEDYFLPEIQVQGIPDHLRRGQQFIHPAGTAHDVRLKRYLKGEKKVGQWAWQDNPFSSTRELNGLRVLMALINNRDTKDENNGVYQVNAAGGADPLQTVYMVSDLGASFGTTGVGWQLSGKDGNLANYRNSKFIVRITADYVDFATPSRPLFVDVFDPSDFFMRVHMRWIGRGLPRSDVRWIAGVLEELSPQQIRDAFRAAGYSPAEVEGFSEVVEKRISDLGKI